LIYVIMIFTIIEQPYIDMANKQECFGTTAKNIYKVNLQPTLTTSPWVTQSALHSLSRRDKPPSKQTQTPTDYTEQDTIDRLSALGFCRFNYEMQTINTVYCLLTLTRTDHLLLFATS